MSRPSLSARWPHSAVFAGEWDRESGYRKAGNVAFGVSGALKLIQLLSIWNEQATKRFEARMNRLLKAVLCTGTILSTTGIEKSGPPRLLFAALCWNQVRAFVHSSPQAPFPLVPPSFWPDSRFAAWIEACELSKRARRLPGPLIGWVLGHPFLAAGSGTPIRCTNCHGGETGQ